MTASRVRERRRKVFNSVFQTQLSQPTPVLPATEAGEAFGVPHPASGPAFSPARVADLGSGLARASGTTSAATGRTSRKTHTGSPLPKAHEQQLHGSRRHHHHPEPRSLQDATESEQQVRWDRAWHAVTSRIQLPASVTVEDSFGTLGPESQDLGSNAAFYDSLSLLLNSSSLLPRAAHTDDILLWHTQQVRRHFVHHVMPLLAACASQGDRRQILVTSVHTLEAAHRQYFYGLSLIVRGLEDEKTASAAIAKFKRDLHAIIGNSWTQGLVEALRSVLGQLLGVILGLDAQSPSLGSGLEDTHDQKEDDRVSASRVELLNLVESLQEVGLAGDRFQVLFAQMLDACMIDYIHKTYSGSWKPLPQAGRALSEDSSQLGCLNHLSGRIENHYGRLAVEVFSRLGGHITWTDVERWREIAVGRLAALRMQELFDIVLHWPHSNGGLEDLRSVIATPQRRLQLTDVFSATLQKRLLQPDRSTLEILQTYISMIRTFHALDHSKVLLNRVVHALQLYLCQRDDAIRTVVTGLLSDPKASTTDEGRGQLVELAVILDESSQQQRHRAGDDDLDWNDMTWVPDPVDAGVNYKRPKNEDVIGTLITALGSQDIFIKEFQQIIAERLLSNQPALPQAAKVLGLLKKRFGESALQNCDVMVKDIQDSKRIDATLRKSLRSNAQTDADDMAYHSRILSRLFWPSLPTERFAVPPPVAEAQRQYATGFEQLKSSRKLNWLDQLGSATVKLEFEDRSVELECKTYEAAVIYAFQNRAPGESEPRQWAFNELWQSLTMDEDLLEAALRFWISKRVLRDVGKQTYVVLERLDAGDQPAGADDDEAPPDMGSAQGGIPSPRKTKMDSKERERRAVYWQFIVGMLTNSGPAMPLSQISMMMKMLIADGCPWSNEELQEFLGEKVAEKEMEFAGGKYRLTKK